MKRVRRYNEGLGTNFDDYEYDEDATWYAPVIIDVNELLRLIKQGKFYGGNARKGYCFTIQAHGSRTVRNLGGRRWHEDKNSSKSWGRIWVDGHMIFSEDATLNVVRSHMIEFLRDKFDKAEPLRTETISTRELDESVEYKGYSIVKESKGHWNVKLGNSDFSYKSLKEARSAIDDLDKDGLLESFITRRM